MLARLSVENFALFERCDVELAAGLNALTGETGAGKSLLIDAIETVLGARASVDLIRLGADSALAEAFFVVEDAVLVSSIEEILGSKLENGEVLIRRKLPRSGRFTAEVNGRVVPLSVLRQVGELLVDIHGQNEHQRLIQPSVQMDALDSFAGLSNERAAFQAAYQDLRSRVDALSSLAAERETLEREKDFLAHRVSELEAAAVKSDDELDELLARRQMAAHHQQISDAVAELHRRAYHDDDSLAASLDRIAARLGRLQGLSPEIDRWAKLIEEASLRLNEAGREAGEFLASYDWSPGELERIDDRIAVLRSVCRKYGPTPADCRATLAAEKAKLDSLGSIDIRLDDARKAAEAARKTLLAAGQRLSKARNASAAKLSKRIESELASLGMDEARFRVDFATLTGLAAPEDVKDASPAGLESCEYMLMPNPGEGWAALRKIASGGEIARTMLALKSVLAAADRTPVLIFDEIDADIGGRLGEALGRKLRAISAARQVLVVTHLPQIAAFAERQLRVEKATDRTRTIACVKPLAGGRRIEELAEMLRGPKNAKEAYEQAEKMLKAALK
jgi:DNA repair protein RecN (Recombination protein N)